MKNMSSSAVKVHDLTVAYDEKPVLWDVDLEIPSGSLCAVVGPNGAGKSTLLKAILGLLKPVSGGVDFPSIGLNKKTHKIAYVPQSSSVDWDFPATVLDIVMMGRYGHLGWFKRAGKKEKEMAIQQLKNVGMEQFVHRQISELSGGQQQRVFLARSLVQEAEIYFMDEPLKGVDAQTEKVIIGLLKKLRDEGKTVIVVHHDLRTVKTYFDRVVLINLRVVADGAVNDTFTEENIAKAYGGYVIGSKEGAVQ